MKHDNIIAIDPDVSESGVAILRPATKSLSVYKMNFPDVLDYIREQKRIAEGADETILVVIEASWMIKGNWHLSSWERKQRAASKGYDVGRNHEVGRKIGEVCRHIGIELLECIPLRKCWRGTDGKITQEELASFTGLSGRTNQDQRDAALLAWVIAGLPICVKYRNVSK